MISFIFALYLGFMPAKSGPYDLATVPQHVLIDQYEETTLHPEVRVTFTFSEEQLKAVEQAIQAQKQSQSDIKEKTSSPMENEVITVSVYFDFDSSYLKPTEKYKLMQVLTGTQFVSLEGHASSEGTDEYNVRLSDKRNSEVEKFLKKMNIGVKSKTPYGESQCKVSREEWPSCRRVDIKKEQ